MKLDGIHELGGKPIIRCDFANRFNAGEKGVRMWKLAENLSAFFGVTRSRHRKALANPVCYRVSLVTV